MAGDGSSPAVTRSLRHAAGCLDGGRRRGAGHESFVSVSPAGASPGLSGLMGSPDRAEVIEAGRGADAQDHRHRRARYGTQNAEPAAGRRPPVCLERLGGRSRGPPGDHGPETRAPPRRRTGSSEPRPPPRRCQRLRRPCSRARGRRRALRSRDGALPAVHMVDTEPEVRLASLPLDIEPVRCTGSTSVPRTPFIAPWSVA